MPYNPEQDDTKKRQVDIVVGDVVNSWVNDGFGTPITSTGGALDVSATIVPGPAGTNDYFSAEVDETGIPLNPIPAGIPPYGAMVICVFVDLTTLVPFTSQGVIFENLSGVDLWISFDPLGTPGTFHRVRPGRSVAFDALGSASIAILDPSGAGGQSYNVHAWG